MRYKVLFVFLRSLFSNDLLIELSEQKILIKSFSSNATYDDEPWIALENINGIEIVKGIGKEAKKLTGININIVNPFSHTRSFIGSYVLAEKIIQHGVLSIHKSKIRPAPRIIMHQLEKTEGGLTDVEDRVLRELAVAAGAR